ncbi:MAG: hypothetical protein A2747_02785 [Candidatus Yonathbacteria bacterium RIFCSPHIGHO2_01_FULL_44_41]|uniref:VanZ-like domain-containing protein n=1 Tax=Candidatus Yonathbacteria bacterium RIFCSPHIGHO2_02_FULL_44_14 TaxID=1802724 RepID=A0A1G2S634_9BACT|nr:MAG: hypothetical protein A2747_02785 [Candidatus Yonathbacteria bacterium RIFCSPHIGHO2_01_FULL_44_41]OHA80563.1 MAG: hypothetical protein A3D51_00605 [Candidatus Yonathbacteria bacterium RIFCSPHIGHO2_02_FULL_44_14]OHA82145.1 MAG: hypothetical protein A3B06_01390 [Candidatus Yonathbacteria bacterium RIFCSPLOWO2_01_FULL_43_20]
MPARQLQIPIILVIFLVAIAVVNGLAGLYHWYWTMRWFDMPMHFAGGMWLAGFGVWWQYSRRGVTPQGFFSLLGVCLVYALSIGLLWEAYEAVVSFLTVGHMNAVPDTLGDLLFDILGGTTVAILVFVRSKLKP